MKTKTKIIGSILLIFALLGGMVVGLGIWFYQGFIDWRCNFPSQLRAGPLIHEAKRVYSMGPAGLNNAFVVYALPDPAVRKIEAEGSQFLESIPMTFAQKIQNRPAKNQNLSWEPFDQWTATPIPPEPPWLRARIRGLRKYDEPWEPSLANFYDEALNREFLSLIAPEFAESFHEVIRSPGNLYSYGANRGACVLVVSPSLGRVYYLRR